MDDEGSFDDGDPYTTNLYIGMTYMLLQHRPYRKLVRSALNHDHSCGSSLCLLSPPRCHQPVIIVSGRENSVFVCKIGFGFGSASCLQLRKSLTSSLWRHVPAVALLSFKSEAFRSSMFLLQALQALISADSCV